MARTQADGLQVDRVDNIQSGIHTERPTTPALGDIWVSTDVKKFFACFVAGNWVHINPVDITGSVDGDFFAYDGATGFLKPKTVSALQYGLEEDLPENPDVGDVYMATDTETVYYCFTDDIWLPTYLSKSRVTEFEYDDNEDITIVDTNQIFETDSSGDLMPSEAGTLDTIFEIISNEITPKV